MSSDFTDISSDELDSLIERVREAKVHHLALSPDDCQRLLDALLTLTRLQNQLSSNDITLHKLRKLLGMVNSSEKLQKSLSKSVAQGPRERKKPAIVAVKPEVIHHQHDSLKKGEACPQCDVGKVYKYEPATLLRITGQTPFVAEQHVMERLRCNTCGAYFTASLPEEVQADGGDKQKYGYSARALMSIAKFYAGSPYYRQGSMQDLLGVPISASTIFDQVEYTANHVFPVLNYLKTLAANARHYYLDDTRDRILQAKAVLKKQRHSDKTQLRSGIYTSGLIASTAEGYCIVLFETSIGHAGEFIDDILRQREQSLPAPLLMSDALSANQPTVTAVHSSLCNSHARRQFFDVMSHFPDEVNEVLERYGRIWEHETKVKHDQLGSEQRLAYHQTHSQPEMAAIKHWGEQRLAHGAVEENSSLGKAIRYFIKHYEGLSAFCRIEGAQLDNNVMEAQLKLAIRDRNNAQFHQTQAGASIADVLTSLIATCIEAGANALDYLTLLQREHKQVAAAPQHYLPWNYLDNNKG